MGNLHEYGYGSAELTELINNEELSEFGKSANGESDDGWAELDENRNKR